MPHAHVQVMKDIDDAMTKEDMDAFFGNFTDDVKVHTRGNNKLAGDYVGKDQLQALFGRFMEATGAYSFESHAYLADDDHGVNLQTSHSQRDGKTFDSQETIVMHFRGGKVSEMWYIPVDGAAFDAWIGR